MDVAQENIAYLGSQQEAHWAQQDRSEKQDEHRHHAREKESAAPGSGWNTMPTAAALWAADAAKRARCTAADKQRPHCRPATIPLCSHRGEYSCAALHLRMHRNLRMHLLTWLQAVPWCHELRMSARIACASCCTSNNTPPYTHPDTQLTAVADEQLSLRQHGSYGGCANYLPNFRSRQICVCPEEGLPQSLDHHPAGFAGVLLLLPLQGVPRGQDCCC
jgi:hypothetical protein